MSKQIGDEFLICPVCYRKMKFIAANHIIKHGYTTKEFKEKFNIINLKIKSITDAHSKLMLENNPMQGVVRSEEEKKLISETRTGKGIGVSGKYIRTKEIKEKISNGVTLAYIEGRANSINTLGSHIFSKKTRKLLWCASPYERRIVILLECHPFIEYFEREPLHIPYFFDGIMRNYIPDFYVRERDSKVESIWEFKTASDSQYAKSKAKKKVLFEYGSKNNINIFWVDKDMLEKMELTNAKYIKDYVSTDYIPKDYTPCQ